MYVRVCVCAWQRAQRRSRNWLVLEFMTETAAACEVSNGPGRACHTRSVLIKSQLEAAMTDDWDVPLVTSLQFSIYTLLSLLSISLCHCVFLSALCFFPSLSSTPSFGWICSSLHLQPLSFPHSLCPITGSLWKFSFTWKVITGDRWSHRLIKDFWAKLVKR